MRTLVVASDEWWESLSKEQQEAYIEEHPNSKYAKKAKKSEPKGVQLAPKAVKPKKPEKVVWKPTLKSGKKVIEVDITAGNIKGFTDSYLKGTTEDPRYKGEKEAMRIWKDPDSAGEVFIDIEEKKMSKDLKVGYLHAIQVSKENAGKGLSSKALQWSVDQADKNGVTLMLKPKAFGSKGLTTAKLKAWYARHGFLMREGDEHMIRPPKGHASREVEPTKYDGEE